MNYFNISNALVLEVRGPHATRYLQARLTNDMRSLTREHGMLAAALSPQGKTEGLFTVFMLEENAYLLYADGGDAGEVKKALGRFLVAERVEILDRTSACSVLHYFDSGSTPTSLTGDLLSASGTISEYTVRRENDLTFVRKRRGAIDGWDVLGAPARIQAVTASLQAARFQELSPDAIELFRLQGAVPQFPRELGPEYLFVSAGLSEAVSFTKGCYTGQEVVAKVDALGKPPRVLKLLSVPSVTINAQDDVVDNATGKPLGKIISLARDPAQGRSLCFADLRNVENMENVDLRVDSAKAAIVAV